MVDRWVGARGFFGSHHGKALADVMAALDATAAVKRLNRELANASSALVRSRMTYLLERHEIWARAYAQFIATESGDPLLMEQLRTAQARSEPIQWTDEDFRPVAEAIRKAFRALGWL